MSLILVVHHLRPSRAGRKISMSISCKTAKKQKELQYKIHLGYPETDRPKPVLNKFNKKVVKPKVSFSILPTNIPIP
jgi:hypothetical protein